MTDGVFTDEQAALASQLIRDELARTSIGVNPAGLAAAADFQAAQEQLLTSPGYAPEQVEELKRGILDLANSITGDEFGSRTGTEANL